MKRSRIISLCLVSVLSIICKLNAENLNSAIPYNRGEQYSWAWLMYSIQTGLGMFINMLVLDLFLSLDNSSKTSVYSLNVALNVVDILLLFECFIRSTISYAAGSFYGGYHQKVFCYLDDILNGSFVLWSICIIVGISYLARVYLCTGEMLTQRQMIGWTIGSQFYSMMVGFIGIYIPGGHSYGFDSSGTYCFITPSIVTIPVVFLFSLVIPFNVLIYNLYYIRKAIADSQKLLEELGIEGQAKVGYIQMVKKFGYFLLAICFCEFPVLINGIQAIITSNYPTPNASIVAGTLALSNAAFINPSLFILLNVDLQEKFWEKYGYIFQSIFFCFIVSKKYSSISPDGHSIKSIKVGIHGGSSIDYNDWKVWMSDESLKKTFNNYGKSIYAMENLSFYEDVMKYHGIGESCDDISTVWEELNRFANRLYILYIKIPRAPLEININYGTRNELLKILHRVENSNVVHIRSAQSSTREAAPDIKSVMVASRRDSLRNSIRNSIEGSVVGSTLGHNVVGLEVGFPDISKLSKEEANAVGHEYLHAFDDCLEVVSHIIATDIWPRFRKSVMFETAKKEHIESINEC